MTMTALDAGAPNFTFERERGVYGLRVTHDVAHAVIETGEGPDRTEQILTVFHTLAEADVPVFLIKMHRAAVTLGVAGAHLERAAAALRSHGLTVVTRRDLALVVVMAASMRELHGVVIAIADALFEADANLLEIGDSHDSVQCLIEASRVEPATTSLLRAFHLDPSTVVHNSVEAEARS